MNLSAVIAHWLHLMSAIIWIGAAAYQVFVLGPLIKTGDLPKSMIVSLAKRYRYISLTTLLVLVTTGGINIKTRRMGFEAVPGGYISALAVKVFIAVAMAAGLVFGMIRSSGKYDGDPSEESESPQFGANKVTLAMGTIVIFLASMLRHWISP
jgi:uncharacterized membrane protein